MKFATRTLLLTTLLVGLAAQAQSPMRQQALREAAVKAGVVPLSQIQVPVDPERAEIGSKLFESTALSLNSDTSCQTCHLDAFSSADGLPNAVGTRGHGEGPARMGSNGDIVPRNTLPLWGRGTKGFDTFFWDGKVERTEQGVVSQFGAAVPSNDPLVVAVHLPFVEIREMVARNEDIVENYEHEETSSAGKIFNKLTERVKRDPELGKALSKASGVEVENLTFIHVAEAVASFIRSNFKISTTPFDDFVFKGGELSEEQVRGGLIFFGKGQCSSCHNGPLFSDLDFHVMPFDQAGFGKNGFGVDYGRFNATLDPDDTYKFRTPPLINVTKTGPYSHSGAYRDLEAIILAHADPLHRYNGQERSASQRREYLAKLTKWSSANPVPESLSTQEMSNLISFLGSLEQTETKKH